MEGFDENSSNDIAAKEIKDFKKAVIESIDTFLSNIELETKRKGTEQKDIEIDIEKKDIKKKDTAKEHIEKVN